MGIFHFQESICLRGTPSQVLGFASQYLIWWSPDGSYSRQEAVVIDDHSQEFLEGLDCGGCGEALDGGHLVW